MDDKIIHILLVEDNRADQAMIEELLSETNSVQFALVSVNRLSAALVQLSQQCFDLILLDLSLPDSQGLQTLVEIQRQIPRVPIVVMTGLDDEELAVAAVGLGAQDYLVKAYVNQHLLVRAVRYAIERKHTLEALRESEERFRLLVAGGKDYAIFTLSPQGIVVSWNAGVERIQGYTQSEIIGQHFSCFYIPEDVENGKPDRDLQLTVAEGRFEDELWQVRKDGSRFWAAVTITALRDESGQLRGFAKVTRDLTERQRAEAEIRQLHEDLKRRAVELEAANKELEAFNYSVSHDLRNPLLIIDGMSWALQQKYSPILDDQGKHYLVRVRAACKRMAQLIEDLLHLSQVSRTEIKVQQVPLSEMVEKIANQLKQSQPNRLVEFEVLPGVLATGDERLLQIIMENLLGNAWKYTGKKPSAKIQFGVMQNPGEIIYFVRDNGVGFSMANSEKLFGAFQRLHQESEFEGSGIGLATVERIIRRHGGRIWAEAEVDLGATFYFTLGDNLAAEKLPTVLYLSGYK